ncbi:AAA family ATPase [Stigmatella hybrida]|uniref:AAA family ATPase n=1 Tax=Stigmatella hybrida TaxID=394097 RepID=UPI001CDB12FC|nr:ATP-binding protein [Stigmatella hybrida]
MIESLDLHIGDSPDSAPLQIKPGPITVFIGPNNSGKSLLLRELGATITGQSASLLRTTIALHYTPLSQYQSGRPQQPLKILREIHFTKPTSIQKLKAELITLGGYEFENRFLTPPQHTLINTDHDLSEGRWLDKSFFEFEQNQSDAQSILLATAFIMLDGETRLSLVKSKKTAPLSGSPKSILQALFTDEESRRRLGKLTFEAFNFYAVIDPTEMRRFHIRMSTKLPSDTEEESSLSVRARDFYRQTIDIMNMSDGVKAYTGLLAALLSRRHRIITIDEPEAFLHPALARRLGVELSRLATEQQANVFASTHSADFLMGCIESGHSIQIVRLTYQEGIATAKHLSSTEITNLMRNPLLRTTNVLSALFHTGAVVTESEADRAFYDEINHRLQSTNGTGVSGASFLFAQNKQTTHMIVRPLRQLGIPTAAIVDMDFIKDGGKNFTNLLSAAGIPDDWHQSLGSAKAKIQDSLDKISLDWKRLGGISLLSGSQARACLDFFESLEGYGIFVVPVGELEGWLSHLNAPKSKHSWLYKIFEKMGSDPAASGYERPAENDVWAFMRRVASWLQNPHRKGMYY